MPDRPGAQIVAIVCAACMPMHVYISLVFGNEPVAAAADEAAPAEAAPAEAEGDAQAEAPAAGEPAADDKA